MTVDLRETGIQHFSAIGQHFRAIGSGKSQDYALVSNRSLGTCPIIPALLRPSRCQGDDPVFNPLREIWRDERGQDVAEYAVMLAVILVIVLGTVRLIGSNANTIFSQVGSAIQ